MVTRAGGAKQTKSEMGSTQSRVNAATGVGAAGGAATVFYAVGLTLTGGGAAVVVGTVVGKAVNVVAKTFVRSARHGGAGTAAATGAAAAASVVAGPVGAVLAAAFAGPAMAVVAKKLPATVAKIVSTVVCVAGCFFNSVGCGVVGGLLTVALNPDVQPFLRDVSAKALLGYAMGCVVEWLFPTSLLLSVGSCIVLSPVVNWAYEELTAGRDLIDDKLLLFSHYPIPLFGVAPIVYSLSAPFNGVAQALFHAWVWGSNAGVISTFLNGPIALYRVQKQAMQEREVYFMR